jgi:hypothetical protein
MNTANLQLEGVYLVLSELIEALIAKGVFQKPELIAILSEVERRIGADSSRPAEIRDANVEAALFPARFLKSALRAGSEGGKPSFADVVSRIKETRRPQEEPSVTP